MAIEDRDFWRTSDPHREESERPSLLNLLILTNIGVFLLQHLFAVPQAGPPAGHISLETLHKGEFWTVFTHLFVHNDPVHLGLNMFLLWLAGRAVLRKTGARHFGYIYFIGGWTGSFLQLFLGHAAGTPMIGASPAVFAVIGAFAALFPYHNLLERFPLGAFRLRIWNFALAFLVAEILLDVGQRYWPWAQTTEIIAHLSHAGGIAVGLLYGRLVSTRLPEREVRVPWPQQSKFALNGQFPAPDPVPLRTASRRVGKTPELPPPLSDREFIQDKVNPILDKLFAQGPESLSEDERAILDEAALRLSIQEEP